MRLSLEILASFSLLNPVLSINGKFNYFRPPASYIYLMTNNPDFLIVYGTLRPPFDNTFAQYLRQRGRCVGEGTFGGQVFDMGSYPGAIQLETSSTRVHGTVFNISSQKSAILTYLDYYEGVGEDFDQPTEFIRAIVPVLFNDAITDCWVYLYNLPTHDKPLIESGDYAKHIGNPYKSPV
jgi:gamma-glutamylcyclotransferase (GGCT)/AIG2-like uncharacterized protein YtfP